MRNNLRLILLFLAAAAMALAAEPRFEVSFAAPAHDGPITGRIFVAIGKAESPEPIRQVGSWTGKTPFFAADVEALAPGRAAVIDASSLGYPAASLKDVPAGDYYVQALVNVYTRFPRADGHTVWAHMDQWEGQQFTRSPGNLYSEVHKVHLDPAAGYDVKLELTHVIPPVELPADTAWVKHIRIQSPMLSKFWGHPIYVGATVLLPKGYDQHPEERYPVIYIQGHFGLNAPYGFSETGGGRGAELSKAWMSDDFPRMIAVTWQHPTPYFDDSYAVNSANDGPYGDALLKELVPYLEQHFRMIRGTLGARADRRVHRRMGIAGAPGLPPRFLRRHLDALPRPHRLSSLPDGQYLRGRQRLHRPGLRVHGAGAPHDAHGRGPGSADHAPDEPARGRARQPRPLRPAVRGVGGGLRTGGRGRLSQAALGQTHRQDRQVRGALHEGARLRPGRVSPGQLEAPRPAASGQAPPLCRRHG